MRVAIAMIVLVAIGCASEPTVEAPERSARDILATPQLLALDDARTRVELDVRLDRGDHVEATRAMLPSLGGSVEVAADGDALWVRSLELDLAPIEIPTTIVPAGLRLTAIHLGLAAPVRGEGAIWSEDGDVGRARAIASLTWDWALDTGDDAWPLAPQRIDDVEVELAIGRDGPALNLDASASARGTCWRWADLVVIGNVTMVTRAGAP